MAKYHPYPDLTDPDFFRKIYLKKEFRDYQMTRETRKIEEVCTPGSRLLPQQELLRNYISPDTPYNGVLVFHGTGVGKTCTAVSIAEGFVDDINYGPALVILGRQIRGNFIKEIYDIGSLRSGVKKKFQCTGDRYKLPERYRHLTVEQKVRMIEKKINENYEFQGYIAFANYVQRISGWNGEGEPDDDAITIIRNEYSNRVIIVDEIQNIKDEQYSITAPYLKAVVRYADNVKLVLMSATPMFNSPDEIVFILNLFLINDGREPLTRAQLFDEDGNLKPEGETILRNTSRGYISYVRGKNAVAFPLRIPAPGSAVPKGLKFTVQGNRMDDPMKYTKILECPMGEYQYESYKKILLGDSENEDEVVLGIRPKLLMASNIVLPPKQGLGVVSRDAYSRTDSRTAAFIERRGERGNVFYEYQKHAVFGDGTTILSESRVAKYSSKFAKALDAIKNSTGLVFIYVSNYIEGGLVPFCLMLEQNGIQRYQRESPLLRHKTAPYICYKCSQVAKAAIHTNKKRADYHKFRFAKYIVVSSQASLNRYSAADYVKTFNDPKNRDGEMVRIYVGNNVVSEGIDFVGIRSVHIIEPWFNRSRIEQIVGRAIRHCSHVAFPERERNVEIYQYAASAPAKYREMETYDLYLHRIAEHKDVRIKDVERILKEEAIDCALDYRANVDDVDREITSTLASGKTIKYKETMRPYTQVCDYKRECKYKCSWMPVKGRRYPVDTDTYSLKMAKSSITLAKEGIQKMFQQDYIYQLSDIVEYLKEYAREQGGASGGAGLDDLAIYKALDDFVNHPEKEAVVDRYDREGYVIYRGDYYIFQPYDIDYVGIPMYYRQRPLTIKPKSVDIYAEVEEMEEKEEEDELRGVEMMDEVVSDYERDMVRLGPFLEKNKIGGVEDILLHVLVDHLSNEKLVKLLREVLATHLGGEAESLDTPVKKKLFKVLDPFYLRENRNIHHDRAKTKGPGKILGFRVGETYQCYNRTSGRWKQCEKSMINKVKLVDKLHGSKTKASGKKHNIIYGLLERVKDKIVFKIADGTAYIGRVSQTGQVSQRSVIKGRTCGSYNVKQLASIQKKIGIKDSGRYKRDMICLQTEVYMRHKEATAGREKTWFVPLERVL